ncbi:MAG TPA: hypothetical protein VGM96_30780 [Reyranella sp.]|jgi:hypothetical protein
MALPTPEPGLVISYAYLWHVEHVVGREGGRKDRPVVIVLAVKREADGETSVIVLPITHSAPSDPASTVELPMPVKRHLGLDDQRSWIIISEGNEFVWPGYDLRKLPNSDRYDHGFLPPRLFNQVVKAFAGFHRRSSRLMTISGS